MEREDVHDLVRREKWANIIAFPLRTYLNLLGYNECMMLAYDLFFKNLTDAEIRTYAVDLFFAVRERFLLEWAEDWKNEVFLGKICSLIYDMKRAFASYKKVYESLSEPPEGLLLLMAECNKDRTIPYPISDEESEFFLKRAAKICPTYECSVKLRELYRNKGDSGQERYWDKMRDELDAKNIHTQDIIPDVFREKTHSSKEQLQEFIRQGKWAFIASGSLPENLVQLFDYKTCMFLVRDIFAKEFKNDFARNFAIRLGFAIRVHFPAEWSQDWKNDIFLGTLCGETYRYDEKYDCYKRAYDRVEDPPQALLLLLSGCSSAPGVPPLSKQEGEAFLKRAAEKKITFDVALRMRGLCRGEKDRDGEIYWEKKVHELERKNIRREHLGADIFKAPLEITREMILNLFQQEKWSEFISLIPAHEVTSLLDYDQCMLLIHDMCFKNLGNEDVLAYLVNLLFDVHWWFSFTWSEDWKNDVFLGDLFGLTKQYEKQYQFYKSAFEKCKDPPEALLLLLGDAALALGAEDIAETYIRDAIDKRLTYEAAIRMRDMYARRKDRKQEKHWDVVSRDLQKENVHTEKILPDVFQ